MVLSGEGFGREGKLPRMSPLQDLEEASDSPHIWEANSSSSHTTKLLSLGRIFGILFAAESVQLERALAQNQGPSQQGSVGKAVFSLTQLVKHMVSEDFPLDQICLPILDHAVKSKDPSYRKKSFMLMRWLLQSNVFGLAMANTLVNIIRATPGQDRVKLGWCLLVREILQSWSGQVSSSDNDRIIGRNVEVFAACIPSLVDIVCRASIIEGLTKFPTRLAVAAADCLLMIIKTLTISPPAQPEFSSELDGELRREKKILITSVDSAVDDSDSSDSRGFDDPRSSSSDLKSNFQKREMALWDQLDNLVTFVREMRDWNEKERPLFGTGLQWLNNRLWSLKNYRDSLKSEDADGDLPIGAAVLAACWEHFSVLMVTRDKKLSSNPQPTLLHWLGALQYYSNELEGSGADEVNRKALEMRGYALACLALIVGRLDAHHLELVLAECEADLLKGMFDQMRDADRNIEDLAVALIRAIIFRRSPSTSGSVATSGRMDSVVPMLMDMLDARDVAARAVVILVAEYFAANPDSKELEQLFSRLDSEEPGQRRNALDVLTELFSIYTKSEGTINLSCGHIIATQLFKRLGDTELSNRKEVSALFAKLDPAFTLPKLLEFLYSPDGRVRSAAGVSILSVLKDKRDQSGRVVQLLDCTTNMLKSFESEQDIQGGKKASGRRDIDRVVQLLPSWAASVGEWENVIHVVLTKMFREPENVVIPRFLSSISMQLAGQVCFLFPLVLKEMRSQAHLTGDPVPQLSHGDSQERDGRAQGKEIFQRLSPLLVLRVLPLSAFSHPSCEELYDVENADKEKPACITRLLVDRMCGMFEFDDVRRVASELVGRLLPDIMIPLVTAQLRDACGQQDTLRVKACIYAICVSLGARDQDSLRHPLMSQIRQLLAFILVWPTSMDGKTYSDVGKAQHGCIDCLAMMVCAELQPQTAAISPSEESLTKEDTKQAPPSEKEEKIGSRQEVEGRTSSKNTEIKFVTELPESEQLKRHGFEDEGKYPSIDIPIEGDQFDHKGLANERHSFFIEELDDDTVGVRKSSGNGEVQQTVLFSVINCLTGEQQGLPWLTDPNAEISSRILSSGEGRLLGGQMLTMPEGLLTNSTESVPLEFRLCMANVLISAAQKVTPGVRGSLASKLIPSIMAFIRLCPDSKLRSTCIQVLFTAVYHLKAIAVLPFAAELFSLAVAAIKIRGLVEERLGGAKLLAGLLASEEVLVRELAPYFVDAQLALSSISLMDNSPELRMLCEKLLSCLSTPGD